MSDEFTEKDRGAPPVGSSAWLGGVTESRNDSVPEWCDTSQSEIYKMPSQWTISDWLQAIDQCPVLMESVAKTSDDRMRVEGWLRRWKEAGRPKIEFPQQKRVLDAPQILEPTHQSNLVHSYCDVATPSNDPSSPTAADGDGERKGNVK